MNRIYASLIAPAAFRLWVFMALCPLAASCQARESVPQPTVASDAQVQTAFNRGCESMLIHAVQAARSEILVAIYSLTSERIVSALIAAHRRGVQVELKYDSGQADTDSMRDALRKLRKADIPCQAIKLAAEGTAMHNKFVVVDKRVVLTGSFNFTATAAYRNDENLVQIDSPVVAGAFRQAYETIRSR